MNSGSPPQGPASPLEGRSGLASPLEGRSGLSADGAEFDVVIVGAGFSGIGMAARLKEQGYRFVVLEKAASLGGTWRDNDYPGCACDVPSDLYSFSFAPAAKVGHDWSRAFAPQKEILAYLHDVADRCADAAAPFCVGDGCVGCRDDVDCGAGAFCDDDAHVCVPSLP